MFKTLNKNDILRGLESILPKDIIKVDEPLKRYTYTETGGEADFYLSPTKNEEVQAIVKFAHENSIPVTYLGNGSNIIIREGGIRGIVLSLLSLNHIETSDDAIIAGSGAAIIDVSNVARDHVLTGLEFACGIPGSIGGAVFMNAGAYGGEVKDCIDYALCVNEKGDLLKLTTAELELDYRNSVVQQKHLVVLEAAFTLEPGKLDEIQAKMDDLLKDVNLNNRLNSLLAEVFSKDHRVILQVNSFKILIYRAIESVALKFQLSMRDSWLM